MKFLLYILTFVWVIEISGGGINNNSSVIPDHPVFLKEYFNPFSRFLLKVDQNPFQNIYNSGKDISMNYNSAIYRSWHILLSGEHHQLIPHLTPVCIYLFTRAP